jgi:hypothetical protein
MRPALSDVGEHFRLSAFRLRFQKLRLAARISVEFSLVALKALKKRETMTVLHR